MNPAPVLDLLGMLQLLFLLFLGSKDSVDFCIVFLFYVFFPHIGQFHMWDAHLLFGTSEADATPPQPVAQGQVPGHLVRRISSAARIWGAAAPWTWAAAAPWIWAAGVPRIWAAAPPRASSCTRSTSWICVARCDWADPCLSDFREIKDRFLQQAGPFDSPSHLPAAAPPAERTHQAAVPIFHPSALAVLGQCIPAAWDFSFLRPWLLAC